MNNLKKSGEIDLGADEREKIGLRPYLVTFENNTRSDEHFFVVADNDLGAMKEVARIMNADLQRLYPGTTQKHIILCDSDGKLSIASKYTDPDGVTMISPNYDLLRIKPFDTNVSQKIG